MFFTVAACLEVTPIVFVLPPTFVFSSLEVLYPFQLFVTTQKKGGATQKKWSAKKSWAVPDPEAEKFLRQYFLCGLRIKNNWCRQRCILFDKNVYMGLQKCILLCIYFVEFLVE